MQKPELSGEIKTRLIARHSTINRLAKDAGNLSASTLRSWINRNKFPKLEWQKIGKLLGLPTEPEEVEKEFDVKWAREISTPERDYSIAETSGEKTMDAGLRTIEGKFERISGIYKDFGEDVKKLFSSMQKDDAFYYFSLDEIPYEMTDEGWRETGNEIIEAIKRGARFVYLFPSNEVTEKIIECGFLPSNSQQAFVHAFNNMSKNVRGGLSDDQLRSKLICLLVKNDRQFPFLSPGHKYVCFVHQKLFRRARALARFPTGTTEVDRHLHLPLDKKCSIKFANFLNTMLKEHQEEGFC